MKLSMRWYGKDDHVKLSQIKQIPGIKGIVSAIYNIPPGEVWPFTEIQALKKEINDHGFNFDTVESVPVHEEIKLGLKTRDRYITNFISNLKNLSRAGIKTVCYNFMPVFDWTRTEIAYNLADGSQTLIYNDEQIKKTDPINEPFTLPGWDASYQQTELKNLLQKYQTLDQEKLWTNLEYFLKAVVPAAEKYDIQLAIHPDDPPWSIFGLPRIITNQSNLRRLINLVPSPSNGLAICTGSLGVNPDNNLIEIIREFGGMNKIFFMHVRNVKKLGPKSFYESAHPNENGSLNIVGIMKALYEVNFTGTLRPDHGRMIWGESGKPGYGLYDRALGASYLLGIWASLSN